MQKILLLAFGLLFFLLPKAALASHIVGGEIQFYSVNAATNRYYVGLNLYFDAINGRPNAETPTISLYFFRKSDNATMGQIELPQIVRRNIVYTNTTCREINDLRTLSMVYGSEITLNIDSFRDPAGYYIVWERCCRNNIITNIVNPAATGETFHLQFPALVRNGQPFLNSSPRFPELKGDYACVNRPFIFDFSGKDPDGDSLVYSLTRPWAGFSTASNPGPIPRASSAYPEITWASGINDLNIIPGPRPLRINPRTGVLNVTAGQTGLYVFAVAVEEYRNKVLIGVVRREFQLKVVDCPSNAIPVALFREKGKTAFYKETETIRIKLDQPRCLDILLTDLDPNQRLTVQTKALNFGDRMLTISPNSFVTRSSTDTLKATVCFDPCVQSQNNQPIVFEVIVSDDGCPQPLTDTLRIRAIIEPTPVGKPRIVTDLPNGRATVAQGTTLSFKVTGTSPENTDLVVSGLGRGFQLAQAGMTFANAMGKNSVTSPFNWTPPCAATGREYVVDFLVTATVCNGQARDTVSVRLNAIPRPNNRPRVSTNITTSQPLAVDEPNGTNKITFEVYADDLDRDLLQLFAKGVGFDLRASQMKFDDKTGPPRLVSVFEWAPDCKTLETLAGRNLKVSFTAQDNSCGVAGVDTLSVAFQLNSLPTAKALENIPNVITPNGDGKNDCFFVENLPNNTCGPQFERVDMFNRWGKKIFSSTDRTFKWCAEDVPNGTYFYGLVFSNQTLKGTLTVLK